MISRTQDRLLSCFVFDLWHFHQLSSFLLICKILSSCWHTTALLNCCLPFIWTSPNSIFATLSHSSLTSHSSLCLPFLFISLLSLFFTFSSNLFNTRTWFGRLSLLTLLVIPFVSGGWQNNSSFPSVFCIFPFYFLAIDEQSIVFQALAICNLLIFYPSLNLLWSHCSPALAIDINLSFFLYVKFRRTFILSINIPQNELEPVVFISEPSWL